MLLFSIHINSPVLTRRLPYLSGVTRITMLMYYRIYDISDNSFTFRLFNTIISLFLHLVSLLSFKEIIRIQNLFKV